MFGHHSGVESSSAGSAAVSAVPANISTPSPAQGTAGQTSSSPPVQRGKGSGGWQGKSSGGYSGWKVVKVDKDVVKNAKPPLPHPAPAVDVGKGEKTLLALGVETLAIGWSNVPRANVLYAARRVTGLRTALRRRRRNRRAVYPKSQP